MQYTSNAGTIRSTIVVPWLKHAAPLLDHRRQTTKEHVANVETPETMPDAQQQTASAVSAK